MYLFDGSHVDENSLRIMSSHPWSCFLLNSSLCPGCGRNILKSIAHSDDEIAAPDSCLSFCSTNWYSLFIAYATLSSFTSFLRNVHSWLRNAEPLSSHCFQNFSQSSQLMKSSITPASISESMYPCDSSSYIVLYICSPTAI